MSAQPRSSNMATNEKDEKKTGKKLEGESSCSDKRQQGRMLTSQQLRLSRQTWSARSSALSCLDQLMQHSQKRCSRKLSKSVWRPKDSWPEHTPYIL